MTRPSDRRRSCVRTARLETCEARELLSAAPVHDFWLDGQQLVDTSLYADLDTAATAAHTLTGLDQVLNTYGFTGTGQTVAVIDSGITYSHYALGGGYGSQYRVVGGWDFAENDADPYDTGPYGSHGTHVAGIIGSSDSTYSGVASGVDLVSLRVFDDSGGGYFSWVEDALWWVHENRLAFENPITAVNLSLGTAYNATTVPSWAMLEDALAQMETDGIFVSVAAGNSFATYGAAGLSYPAVSPYVVAVGSVDAGGSLSSFSQRLPSMIAAPGGSIMSTVPDYVGNYNGVQDDFARYSGTSMAAPYVAGASVLLRQAHAFAGIENVTQDALYNIMVGTADTIYDSATKQYYKRLNLDAAIDAIMPTDDYGSTRATAYSMGTLSGSLNLSGHISKLDDVDWFRFTASTTGTVTVSANINMELAAQWQADGFTINVSKDGNSFTFNAVAGQTYRFGLSTADGLGHYTINVGQGTAAVPGNLTDVQFGDFDGDGQTDIVGRATNGVWWVAINDGNGGYTNQQWTRWSTSATWVDVMVGDFNGDGRDDIVGRVAENGDWWIAKSTGASFVNQKWTRWSASVAWTDCMVGDFNGDGRDDIVGRVAQSGDWWIGSSTGSSFANQKWTRWSAGVTWTDCMVGDFNGDGRDDIVGRVAGNGDWWIGSSTGSSFANQKWTRWSASVTWTDCMVGDFNGDGRDDIVGRVAGNGDWWVANSTGSRFVNQKWGKWSASVTWTDLVTGDFNGDGRADIAGRVASNGDWWLAKSNGGSGFTNERLGGSAAPTGWSCVAVGSHAPAALTLYTAAASSGQLTTASMDTTSLSTAQLVAIADLVAPNASAGLLRDDTLANDTLANDRLRTTDRVLGELAAMPTGTVIERADLLAAVMRQLESLSADGRTDFLLMQSSFRSRAGWLFDTDDDELPSWEALFNDASFDTADLDAYYATLECEGV